MKDPGASRPIKTISVAVGGFALAALAVIVDLGGILPLWNSSAFKNWAAANGRWLALTSVALLVACVVLLINLRAMIADSRQLSRRDRSLFEDLESELPPDGQVMRYMKQEFDGHSWIHGHVDVVTDFGERWSIGKVFDDRELERLRGVLVGACLEFGHEIAGENFQDNPEEKRTKLLGPGDERWKYADRRETIKRLRDSGGAVTIAYDELFHAGRKALRSI